MGKRVFLWSFFALFLLGSAAHAAFPTPTNLATNGDSTNLASYTTASISPPANTLILAFITTEAVSGTPNVPTISGNSLTWVQIGTDVNGTIRGTLFRARGTPTSGAVTIDLAAQTITDCTWSIISVDGAAATGTNGSGAIVQSATNNGAATTSLTVTLGAFASAGNATFGGFAVSNNVAITAGSGFTVIAFSSCCGSNAAIEWRAGNDTTVDATWTSSGAAGVAVEVKPLSPSVGRPLFVD